MTFIQSDKKRIKGGKLPLFQYVLRLLQGNRNVFTKTLLRILYRILAHANCIEIPFTCKIGKGLYIGHPYCITINPKAVLGCNINIHRGVLIGQENRGKRKGVPVIGNEVWIGINSTIVGNVLIGDDVLIAPNSYVNCDVPSHSIVFGNPCVIKHRDNATESYINRKVTE